MALLVVFWHLSCEIAFSRFGFLWFFWFCTSLLFSMIFFFHLFLVCVNITFEDLVNTNNQWMNLFALKKKLKMKKKETKDRGAPT
jgi:hypothetical protein